MAQIVPPPPSIAKGNPFTVTAEGGGYVVTCVCKWLRYFLTRPDATAGQREHAKKCKGEREKAEAKPRRSAAKWSDREGATWIDKL